MHKLTRTLVGATLAGLVLAITPTMSAPADAASNRRCEDTRKGRVCATMHKSPKSSKLGREARRFKSWKYLPMDSRTRVVYRGWARRNLENGQDVWTVRSKVKRKVWHTYTIRQRAECKPFDTRAAKGSDAILYKNLTPRCEGHRWVLRTRGHVPEDAYGWNCYTDGNGSCGSSGRADADGCVSLTTDHYTMCPDGRVYVKDGLAHRAELVRR